MSRVFLEHLNMQKPGRRPYLHSALDREPTIY